MRKLRDTLPTFVLLVMASVFIYGMVFYHDAPIRPCAGGFCGKQGQPHTVEEYHSFNVWQTTLFIVWPIGMIALLLLRGIENKD